MTRCRVKGEGSVYRRGDGRIVGEYEDATGKRRYVSGITKAEVRQKLRKLLADRDEGIAYDSENITVGAYLLKWLEATKGTVRERTWERHEQVIRVHLGPAVGGVKLDRLNALQRCKLCTGGSSKQGCRLARSRSSTRLSTRLSRPGGRKDAWTGTCGICEEGRGA